MKKLVKYFRIRNIRIIFVVQTNTNTHDYENLLGSYYDYEALQIGLWY